MKLRPIFKLNKEEEEPRKSAAAEVRALENGMGEWKVDAFLFGCVGGRLEFFKIIILSVFFYWH